MPIELTNLEIKNWLKRIGKNRTWLAGEMDLKPGTLDQYFSSGFSESQKGHIRYLMASTEPSNENQFSLTPLERKLMHSAMQAAGYGSNEEDFIRDAVNLYSAELRKKAGDHYPGIIESSIILSEEAATYGGTKTKEKTA